MSYSDAVNLYYLHIAKIFAVANGREQYADVLTLIT